MIQCLPRYVNPHKNIKMDWYNMNHTSFDTTTILTNTRHQNDTWLTCNANLHANCNTRRRKLNTNSSISDPSNSTKPNSLQLNKTRIHLHTTFAIGLKGFHGWVEVIVTPPRSGMVQLSGTIKNVWLFVFHLCIVWMFWCVFESAASLMNWFIVLIK